VRLRPWRKVDVVGVRTGTRMRNARRTAGLEGWCRVHSLTRVPGCNVWVSYPTPVEADTDVAGVVLGISEPVVKDVLEMRDSLLQEEWESYDTCPPSH